MERGGDAGILRGAARVVFPHRRLRRVSRLLPQGKAEAFAATLREEGLDTIVGGVPAYSTLGKFNDPILNTMMTYGDDELASIMFHELSHQLVYIPDDSSFNEAFAVAVEQEGLARWLKFRGREADIASTRSGARARQRAMRWWRGFAANSRAVRHERRARRNARRKAEVFARAGDRAARAGPAVRHQVARWPKNWRPSPTTRASPRSPLTMNACPDSAGCSPSNSTICRGSTRR